MVKDAEANAAEDQERRKKVEAHNQLDSLVYNTEKSFGEHKEKLSAEDTSQLEAALEAAKKALESDELSEVETATQNLTQASHKLAEVMYQQSAEADASAAGAGGGNGSTEDPAQDEDIIDAEFVDSDNKSS